MKKYFHIAGCEIQNTLIYRGNTWLTAFFSIFTILLAYLLWSAVFGDSKTFNGFTLPQMVTYYLLSGIL
jgi:ABC-2 type transport system permease protein